MKKCIGLVVLLGFVVTALAEPPPQWYAFDVKGSSVEIEEDERGLKIEKEKFSAMIVTDQVDGSDGISLIVIYEKGSFAFADVLDSFELDYYEEFETAGSASVLTTLESVFAGDILGFGKYKNKDGRMAGFNIKGVGIGESWGDDDTMLTLKIRYNKKLAEELNDPSSPGLAHDLAEYIASKAKVPQDEVEADIDNLLD